MADNEQQPLLNNEARPDVDDIPSHPPPKYEPLLSDEPPPPKYAPTAGPMPLPTYEQSEKYETDGVLEYEREPLRQLAPRLVDSSSSSCSEDEAGESVTDNRGSCCEFTFFFLLCAVFTLAGFVFSLCVASSVAAQSGALTGLGVSFIAKSIIFEVYGVEANANMYQGYCSSYLGSASSDHVEQCAQRAFFMTRMALWILGLIGLYMLHKGLSNFLRTRKARHT